MNEARVKGVAAADLPSEGNQPERRHPAFRAVWYAGNVLLILSVLLAAYSIAWEYSTREYLRGFSDAIIPEAGSLAAQDKIEAILNWMAHGPARRAAGADVSVSDRDPMDTLNYAAFLQVCGSATNAFINLADAAGLQARRLLLLDSQQMTKHVVAEVRVDGRWIVVDPVFRRLLRGTNGHLLTREELTDPAVLSAATQGLRDYLPDYTYDRTAHVRIARIPVVGRPLRTVLDRLVPGWEDSAFVSLLLERESLATMVLAIFLVMCMALLRVVLRWYGEKRLWLRPMRFREQFRRACYSFLDTAG
ncbi:MAG TPA: transglutaminase domain-containing protein [Candidatus Polarisedimenticolia bacterium]|nr:transglutaminase domain-containing protein [Candidatus Polarisedimenticolia bacterium]